MPYALLGFEPKAAKRLPRMVKKSTNKTNEADKTNETN
jgi:hypothetical protein